MPTLSRSSAHIGVDERNFAREKSARKLRFRPYQGRDRRRKSENWPLRGKGGKGLAHSLLSFPQDPSGVPRSDSVFGPFEERAREEEEEEES